jgi:UDP-glucose 4-epimerase
MRVLLTGGAGYIGAHTALALAQSGHAISIVDDLSAVSAVAVERVRELCGAEVPFLRGDVRQGREIAAFVRDIGGVDAIIHLAGVKSVADSLRHPIEYYDVNVGGAISILQIAEEEGIETIVFSSSATVYAPECPMPLTEQSATGLGQASPYGASKRVVEQILTDAARARPRLRAVSLRYFNPVGAHESGRLGEDPLAPPQNLMPVIARAAAGTSTEVAVFGDDYPTADGTALRDYIHVMDLAEAHVAALEHAPAGAHVYNVGTGTPVSVLELIRAFERSSGRQISRSHHPRRAGDLPLSYADPTKARTELGWSARRSIDDACADYWRWQESNPQGYRTAR